MAHGYISVAGFTETFLTVEGFMETCLTVTGFTETCPTGAGFMETCLTVADSMEMVVCNSDSKEVRRQSTIAPARPRYKHMPEKSDSLSAVKKQIAADYKSRLCFLDVINERHV